MFMVRARNSSRVRWSSRNVPRMADVIVEDRIAALAADDENEDMYDDQRREVLEKLFSEQSSVADLASHLNELRSRFTTQVETDETGSFSAQFDELAYTQELHRQVVELQRVTETELDNLAHARAESTRTAILLFNESLQDRAIVGESTEVTKKAHEMIRMRVTLSSV